MTIQIKIDGVKYAQCKDCGVYHKTLKKNKNKKEMVCTKK